MQVSLVACLLTGLFAHVGAIREFDAGSIMADVGRQEEERQAESSEDLKRRHEEQKYEPLRPDIEEDPKDDQEESDVEDVPLFVTHSFHPGDAGFSPNRFTGQIECVGFGGQAFQKGVQTGWWVHKIDNFYKYSEWRLGSYVNGTSDYSVVFSSVKQEFQCADLPYNWKDSKGRTCDDYAKNDYCTSWGAQGSSWPTCGSWSVFCTNRDIHYYKAREEDALSACCACGGGWDPEGPTTSILTTTVAIAPENTTIVATTMTSTAAPSSSTVKADTLTEPDEKGGRGDGDQAKDLTWLWVVLGSVGGLLVIVLAARAWVGRANDQEASLNLLVSNSVASFTAFADSANVPTDVAVETSGDAEASAA